MALLNTNHLKQTTEPEGIIKGLTPDEIKEDIKLAKWNYGHLKYKVLENAIQWTSIYVEKEFREQGLGTDIMRWVENEAKLAGKKYVVVKATTDGKSDILGRFLTKNKYKLEKDFIWKKEI